VWVAALSVARAADSASSPWADEKFSTAVRPVDFSAAGLGKLSPEELARLDALVRDYKSGALLAAKREAAAADAARMAAEEKAARAEVAKGEAEAKSRVAAQRAEATSAAAAEAGTKKSEGGILAKAKVLLTPGTEVEFTETDSRIVGNFTGWEGKAVFTLENGQRWVVTNGGSYVTPAIASPKVKIVPAAISGFWMTIEGVNQRVRVTPLSSGK
jgi:plastocyanin